MQKIKILNASIHNLSMLETLEIVNHAIETGRQILHTVVNAGKIVAMQKDLRLRKSVNESDLINADGQSIVWASKVLGKPLKERVAGIDLMEKLVHLANQKEYRIFFFGAKEEVVKKVVDVMLETIFSKNYCWL